MIYTGSCGDSLSWTVDTEQWNLTITGTGAMTDYSAAIGEQAAPWIEHNGNISMITVESGCTHIGAYAFPGMMGEEIQLPNTIKTIGAHAFEDCWNYMPAIPNGCTTISDYAFYNCYGLDSLYIPASVTSIGAHAFGNCYWLHSLYFDTTGEITMDATAFDECNITQVYAHASSPIYGWACERGWATIRIDGEIYDISIPGHIISIGDEAFSGYPMTAFRVPASVTTIDGNPWRDSWVTLIVTENTYAATWAKQNESDMLRVIELPAKEAT